MCFNDIRFLIYSDLDLIVDGKRIKHVDISSDTIDMYDDYEVIGIRSELIDNFDSKIVISLSSSITSFRDRIFTDVMSSIQDSSHQCKK